MLKETTTTFFGTQLELRTFTLSLFYTFTISHFHSFTLSLLHTFTLLHFHVFTLCFTLLWAPSLSRGLSHVFTISLFHFVYLVVGTPLELSTLNHSSLVSFHLHPCPRVWTFVSPAKFQMSSNVHCHQMFKCQQMFKQCQKTHYFFWNCICKKYFS